MAELCGVRITSIDAPFGNPDKKMVNSFLGLVFVYVCRGFFAEMKTGGLRYKRRKQTNGQRTDDDDGSNDGTDGWTEDDDDDGTRRDTTGHDGTDGERIFIYI